MNSPVAPRRATIPHLAAALAVLLVPLIAACHPATAQTFTTLYVFTGGADGGRPSFGGLIRDAAGNLYGTAEIGGAFGFGTVFEVNTTGNEIVLYSFTGTGGDGAYPIGGLVLDSQGNLFGTTFEGGAYGYGAVFKLDSAGTETVLYSFTGAGEDGAYPGAGLLRNAAGTLYGTTTEGGGSSDGGTVFKLDATGAETILYSFTGGKDGGFPSYGPLIQDAAGNLYGTTVAGGASGNGTVFKLNKTGQETVLHSFSGGAKGGHPLAGLTRDVKGNLYGTTGLGGASGRGTVFRLNKTGQETVLYFFSGLDGASPAGNVIRDATGNLYGTTEGGGADNFGTVFELSKTGKETVLHSFSLGTDGGLPCAGLVRDAAGNLYGTTPVGGFIGYSYGIVFKIAP
jgi:uncharacterized repeat protein (TIGR03803 family)